MGTTGLAQDERFQRHDTGPQHPERPERLAAVARALDERGLAAKCVPIDRSPIDMELVGEVHTADYIERLREACETGQPFIDNPDSAICPESFEIAQLAAGTVINAVDAVMDGRVDNAFCAVRPPGHHAERHLSMGFCLLNNISLAATHLLGRHGLARVLILDWDVHHGNGTQHIFETDPRVLFISLHGDPSVVYPGTGYARETGKGTGEGFTLNLPMAPPSGDAIWRAAFDDVVLPRVSEFAPQFVLISAGFDAHRLDPLAPLSLDTSTYGWMTEALVGVAERHCGGRLVSVLEGGYHLSALGDCVALHLSKLLEA